MMVTCGDVDYIQLKVRVKVWKIVQRIADFRCMNFTEAGFA